MTFTLPFLKSLTQRVSEKRKFIQVILGPRQVGKTTLVRQLIDKLKFPANYCSGDESPLEGAGVWLDAQWETARNLARKSKSNESLLIIDEIHKVHDWSRAVKRNWDMDTKEKSPVKLVILGSAQLLVQKGISDSLAGRYETLYVPQWSFREMRDAFGFTAEQYLWFGGYPGAATLIHDEARWKSYIRESIIRSALQQDLLQLTRVDKPALLGQLFELSCRYSGQIVSLQKLTGQLQDAGNVTTLAHYLELLSSAGFITGLQKYSGKAIMKRASPPKLQVHDNALMSALLPETFKEAFADKQLRRRIIESSVGSHLLRLARLENAQLCYWREAPNELDFVLEKGRKLTAIEVKSGNETGNYKGMDSFRNRYPNASFLLLNEKGNMSWEDWLLSEEL